jgi:hypothetical protein
VRVYQFRHIRGIDSVAADPSPFSARLDS